MNTNGKIDFMPHLSGVDKKFRFINAKLYPLRAKLNTKLNINLFGTFIQPSYRLLLSLYAHASESQKLQFKVHVRIKIKQFCLMPMNTPNYLIDYLCGDIKD